MRLRQFIRNCAGVAGVAIALAAAAPVLAHDGHGPGIAPAGPDTRPEWKGAPSSPAYAPPAVDPRGREEWLGECRRRMSARDDGVGGAVIGGLVGGFAGNRLAGRHHRTVGTIAGAAVGAATGAAIDKAEDQGRYRDQCEIYLEDYYAYQAYYGRAYGYGQPGYGYGYTSAACCQQPVVAPHDPECTETVEYVTEYVPAPARRTIPRRATKVVRDKRVKLN
jgi:hypothetical protein